MPARVRITKEIIAEIAMPTQREGAHRVVVLAAGMPSAPKKDELLDFLAAKGFCAIFPRYRGTWESDGSFLERSPTEDITDIIDVITPNVSLTDIMSDTTLSITPSDIHVIGSSFGGPAALFASTHGSVASAVALSPEVDFRVESEAEPLEWLRRALRLGYGNGYRFRNNDWDKLSSGTFYNPATSTDAIQIDKCYIVYAKDDDIISPASIEGFVARTSCKSTALVRGGHFGLSSLLQEQMYRRVRKHMDQQSTE